jgi:hypothetical protein
LRQQSLSEAPAPSWVQDLDRRLSVALDAQYRLVSDGYAELVVRALSEAQRQVVLITPHVSRRTDQYDRILAGLTDALERQVAVKLVWGDRAEVGEDGDTPQPVKPRDGTIARNGTNTSTTALLRICSRSNSATRNCALNWRCRRGRY